MAASSEQLNLLFITCDQWRADCLSAAGHPVLKTPHLDALGKSYVAHVWHHTEGFRCGQLVGSSHSPPELCTI